MSSHTLSNPVRVALQVLAYSAFALTIAYFSTSPPYRLRADGEALIKLSFSHSAQLSQACRQRSEAELAQLAPNMRTKMDCPRGRADVLVELDMDDKPLYRISTPPTGLRKDGAATVYRRLAIPAGPHRFRVRLADGPDRVFSFSKELDLTMAPGQVLIIDFLAGEGGFVFVRE